MIGRDNMPRHYPAGRRPRQSALPWRAVAATALLLLAGCASSPRDGASGPPPASTPQPLPAGTRGTPAPLDLRADDVLMQAMGLIGTRYRYGGTTPQQGFDCSGFTSFVFREAVGVQLPRTAAEQFERAGGAVPKEQLASGDLVFFRQGRGRIDHVGIYVGEGRFIHAPSRGGRVRIDALASPHWTRSFQGARRPLDGEG